MITLRNIETLNVGEYTDESTFCHGDLVVRRNQLGYWVGCTEDALEWHEPTPAAAYAIVEMLRSKGV